MWKGFCWLLTCNGTCDTGLKQISKYGNFLLRRQGWGRGHGNYMFSMSAAFLCLPKASLERAFLIAYFSFALPFLFPWKNIPIKKVCHSFHGIQEQWGDNRIHGWWMMIWDAVLETLTCVPWHQQRPKCGRMALTRHMLPGDMLLSSFSFFPKLSSFTTSEKMWRGGLGNWVQDLYFAENCAEWDILREGQQWLMGISCWAKSKRTYHSV